MKAKAGDTYSRRDVILSGMGYPDYAAYLASPLWAKIRGRVYAAKGRKCYLCGLPADALHHNAYRPADLKGERITNIHPVCHGCHEKIEFHDGKKRPLSEAVKTYARMRREFLRPGSGFPTVLAVRAREEGVRRQGRRTVAKRVWQVQRAVKSLIDMGEVEDVVELLAWIRSNRHVRAYYGETDESPEEAAEDARVDRGD